MTILPFSAFGNSYHDKPTGISFPDQLGGMNRGEITDFEKDHPGLGVGILYRASDPAIYADIYVYNLGVPSIPTGWDSKMIHDEWKQAEGDIYTIEKQGKYQQVKNLKESSALLGMDKNAPIALRADFSYISNGSKKLSYLYMMGYHKNFIKIRFTFPEAMKAEGEKALWDFISAFGKLISK
jgi:hypothetical protein